MRQLLIAVIVCLPGVIQAEDKPVNVGTTIDKGLAFLTADALKWKEEHNCVSCHHAALVVWAMREAKPQGHAVDEAVLADLTKWIAESGPGTTSLKRPESAPRALNTKPILSSDAWATGQALYALATAGFKHDDEMIARAHRFLVQTQKEDGSWPMTSRPTTRAGDTGSKSLIPITGGGSAWAVIGLARSR